MKKSEAKALFGNVTKLCQVMGISRAAYYRWGDELTPQVSDQVRGAYMRYTEQRDKDALIVFGGKG